MAIRLSLDLSGATCGELIRFAEAVRSARVSPHQPIERSGPDRIDVSVAGDGPDPGSDPRPETYGPGSYGRAEFYGPEPYGRAEFHGPEPYGRAESYGPEYGPPQHRPPGRPAPGGPPGHPGFTGPPGRPAGPWPPYPPGPEFGILPSPPPFGNWPPGVPVHHVTTHFSGARPTQGAYISVHRGDQMFATDVPTETVDRWKSALTDALEPGGPSEAARGVLLELRALLDMEGFPRRAQ